jgi:hypothetical protein
LIAVTTPKRPRKSMTTTARHDTSATDPASRLPTVAISDPTDTEDTRLTTLARRALYAALRDADPNAVGPRGFPVELVVLRSGELVAVEMRGQSSVTGHGKQGLRPSRIEVLRRLQKFGIPVRLVFVEGVAARREAWLHDLPPAKCVARGATGDPDSSRWGWYVGHLDRIEGAFRLPDRVTERRTRPQADLFDADAS